MARIYEETKGRPLYVISEAVNVSPGGPPPAGPLPRPWINPGEAAADDRQRRACSGPGQPIHHLQHNGVATVTKPASMERYHALDCTRAAAMLLGVFYHAIQFGGMAAGSFGPRSGRSSMLFLEWLHSFRMPLFFLISGFFSAMMLEKYGIWHYLIRRWKRIGLPFVLAMFTVVPLFLSTRSMGPGPGMRGPRMEPGNAAPRDRGPGGPPGDMAAPFLRLRTLSLRRSSSSTSITTVS